VTTADGYIRVSRRAGREGESFISPELRRRATGASWADLAPLPGRAEGLPLHWQQALVEVRRGELGQKPGLRPCPARTSETAATLDSYVEHQVSPTATAAPTALTPRQTIRPRAPNSWG